MLSSIIGFSCSLHAQSQNVGETSSRRSLDVVTYKNDQSSHAFEISVDGAVTSLNNVLTLDRKTHLGSAWKVFVTFYLLDHDMTAKPYFCNGRSKEEVFCCNRGESIELNTAFAKSCTPYFEQILTEISSEKWSYYWADVIGVTYPWLLDVHSMKPSKVVNVNELLQVLYKMPIRVEAFAKLQVILSKVKTEGTGSKGFASIGSNLSFKTYTWDVSDSERKLQGGIVGWLGDGTTVWMNGKGSSTKVLESFSSGIGNFANRYSVESDSRCVDVEFFSMYPIRKVFGLESKRQLLEGSLAQKFEVLFENGNKLVVDEQSGLTLRRMENGRFWIGGRFSYSEYIARVLQREVDPRKEEAAKAFAILMQTYLEQNAQIKKGCYQIKDSSKFQRVWPSRPSPEAIRIAQWSRDLILDVPNQIHYHSYLDGSNRLSWRTAAKYAQDGFTFTEILRFSYPQGKIIMNSKPITDVCQMSNKLSKIVANERVNWKRRLMMKQGFEDVGNIQVCLTRDPQAYADTHLNRIYMKERGDLEDLVTLAHEFVHLTFKHHPNGQSEQFAEETAQRLVNSVGELK
ncbi:MAG: DUF2300 domain-containing protein [Proteobacteria bacterium]|nr:DUF2300 domain-containing protein [Pseudomonadota bacterium]